MATNNISDVENASILPPHPFTFKLDPFQEKAIRAIASEQNILVCAKTGSGKTLVGEYQIYHSISRGKRVFYTTPIKSLSNQKFHDLKHQFKDVSVGIMTGDIKFCPSAQIIVMTTEILCNLLYKHGTVTEHLGLTASLHLDDVDAVIFDECHYINDTDRGHVWEETLILLPHHIKLIMLSATLEQPQYFAKWIETLKCRPICLIETTHRVVPLVHMLYYDDTATLTPLMSEKGTYNEKVYIDWTKQRVNSEKNYTRFKQAVKDQRAAGVEGTIEGKCRPESFIYRLNGLVQKLVGDNLVPAIFFTLSRKKCEEYASKISSNLLNYSESASVRNIINTHLHKYTKSLEIIPYYHIICELLEKGIAFHHSGLIPLLKEIIEILFEKGLIKVLFCTETFAVGLNMPTKTVVFIDVKKYDNNIENMRVLRPDEYIQMAGRAGRRGKDILGTVVYFPDRDPIDVSEMKAMMNGKRPPITSRMEFGYSFLMKTLQSGHLTWLKIMEDSYWYRQRRQDIDNIALQIQNNCIKLNALKLTDEGKLACIERETLESAARIKDRQKQAHRDLEHWKNRHMGPRWENEWKVWGTYKTLDIENVSLQTTMADLRQTNASIIPSMIFLQKIGFIKPDCDVPENLTRDHLTLNGVLATEVNEGHPILMVDLFLKGSLHTLSGEEIVLCLSCFMENDEKGESCPITSLNITDKLKEAINVIYTRAKEYYNIERDIVLSNRLYNNEKEKYWQVTTQWIEPIRQWMEGKHLSEICQTYGLFDGNFIRGILKIANMIDEWQSIAIFCEHIDQIEKMDNVRTKIVRDIAITDSLYLHY